MQAFPQICTKFQHTLTGYDLFIAKKRAHQGSFFVVLPGLEPGFTA